MKEKIEEDYKQEWQNNSCSDTITISRKYFEHILNCLANQKYLEEQKEENQKETQKVIDESWDKGMFILSIDKKMYNAFKELTEKYCNIWNENLDTLLKMRDEDIMFYTEDNNIHFKWNHLVSQEIEMWIHLCCYTHKEIDFENRKYKHGIVSNSDFEYIVNRRGFTTNMANFTKKVLRDIGIGEKIE